MNIDVLKAKELYDKKVKFIDIREDFEVKEARIPNTEIIPLSQISHRLEEIPKDEQAVVFCKSGSRSAHLINELRQFGYDKLLNLEEGIIGWYNNKFPIEFG